MAHAQMYTLEVDGCSASFRITRVRGAERVHAPFRFDVIGVPVTGAGDETEVDPVTLLSAKAKLSWPLSNGTERTVEGLIDVVETEGPGYRLSLVHRIGLMADTVDHQVFVVADTLEIVKTVLARHGLTVEARVRRPLQKRAQCVQAFESDLDFVSRLCAEEGITWFALEGNADKVVLVDQPSGFEDAPGIGTLPVNAGRGLLGHDAVLRAQRKQMVVSDKVSLRDYDFQKPMLDQSVSVDAGTAAAERYEYPGGYSDPAVGKQLANIRLEQHRAKRVALHATTNARGLVPGYVVELDDPLRDSISGRWLVIELEHEADDHGMAGPGRETYSAKFVAVPADSGYRAPRPKAPTLGGVQTATVTGTSGQEIHTDAHGRVNVLHRWDRKRTADEHASAPVRVVQPPTSGGFFLPRVGWEAIVSFHGASGDTPIVLGRLYNGHARPPNSLPADKVVSAFGTQTTPGGGGANLVAMNDAAGNENMSLNASKDFNERTENDKASKITANDTWSVGAARKLIVGQVLNVKVGGAQSYSIGGSRTVNVTSNKMIGAASESVMIGGLRTFSVGGDYTTACASLMRLVGGAKTEAAIEHSNRAVQGASMVLVGGTWRTVAGASANVSVLGASTELVAGAKSITASKYYLAVKGALNENLASRSISAGGDRQEGFGAAAAYNIAGAATFEGSDVTVKAKTSLTITAGGVTIAMTPGSVTIRGEFKSSVASVDTGGESYG